jgi:hypothetical protein
MWTTRLVLAVVNALMLLVTSPSAHGQSVNGHPATATEVAILATHGITRGNWRMDGWGIVAVDQQHPEVAQAPRCHFVLDVPLDCNVLVASK